MHTVLELLTMTTGFFEKKAIESPRYNAEMLLAFVLHCRRIDLYLMFDKPVGKAETDQYRELIKKRSENFPLQYLLGSVEFYNVSLQVNQSALIPRPETELLVEEVIEAAKGKGQCRILDIGSGSGNIPVALGHNLKDAEIVSIDISNDALNLAKENAESYGLNSRIRFECMDIFANEIENLGVFDIIVSNPPYVSQSEFQGLQAEIVRYEPRNAVTDEGNGYRFYNRICGLCGVLLTAGGSLFFEAGKDQFTEIVAIMEKNNLSEIRVVKDLQGIERIITGKKI
ncbi:MAG: peptide chain release factor N(5)-glutamine methyltransferase [Ignavibacteriales bacterium]|nr:peptide chain release factor N(5)-glutamine methyltransferase [Ignavibacteriales bacterium]